MLIGNRDQGLLARRLRKVSLRHQAGRPVDRRRV